LRQYEISFFWGIDKIDLLDRHFLIFDKRSDLYNNLKLLYFFPKLESELFNYFYLKYLILKKLYFSKNYLLIYIFNLYIILLLINI
jgi:hypothetical protein